MSYLSRVGGLGAVLVFVPVCFAGQKGFTPDLSRVADGKTWEVINAEVGTAEEDGRRVARLKPRGHVDQGSNVGLALVGGVEFTEGTFELDLKGKGKFDRHFLGVAFNVVDGKTFESVYFRPFNFQADDQAFRARAVQYVSWPDHPWERLRKEHPGVYEAAVQPVPEPGAWFHARVEVTKAKVRVFVNGAKEPCLVADRLATRAGGKVGLMVDSRESEFSNFRIVPAK